ncbi:MAG: glycosyltransferase family 2 protein [Deltaproteobacteria bacterium]|nr:glycosyltransferase family 2 protein [Deltaproteobacteria bacterium]
MLFSIVVPAYNIEEYLNDCVRAILKQSYSNFELILVDDGSTDGTAYLCDSYAAQNKRVRVIHQSNRGLSEARNVGMRNAQGEYIVFVDGDDYIMMDSLKHFSEKLVARPDVLITRLVEVFPDSSIRKTDKKMREDFDTDKLCAFKWVFSRSQNTWPAYKYVVNRSFITKAGLQFRTGYLHEDIDWTAKLFKSAASFSFCCYYWYHYRINRCGAITSDTNIRRPLDIIDIVSANAGDNSYHCLDTELKTLIFERLVMSLFSTVVESFSRYDSKDKDRIVAALTKNKDLFKNARKIKHRLFVGLVRMVGLRTALEITNFLYVRTLQRISRRARSAKVDLNVAKTPSA